MRRRRALWAISVLALLSTAPGQRPQALLGPLPACRPGELLTVRDHALACMDPLVTTLGGAPDCAGQPLTADGEGRLRCAPSLAGPLARRDEIEARLQALRQAAEGLPEVAPISVALTKKKTRGLIARAGTAPGLLSATALCDDEYPGSHMCTGYEVYAATVAGQVSQQNQLYAASWIFHPSWKAPLPGAEARTAGLADNCAGYTYDKDDRGWSGVAISTAVIPETTRWGLRFHSGSQALCSVERPIACCWGGGAP